MLHATSMTMHEHCIIKGTHISQIAILGSLMDTGTLQLDSWKITITDYHH